MCYQLDYKLVDDKSIYSSQQHFYVETRLTILILNSVTT